MSTSNLHVNRLTKHNTKSNTQTQINAIDSLPIHRPQIPLRLIACSRRLPTLLSATSICIYTCTECAQDQLYKNFSSCLIGTNYCILNAFTVQGDTTSCRVRVLCFGGRKVVLSIISAALLVAASCLSSSLFSLLFFVWCVLFCSSKKISFFAT